MNVVRLCGEEIRVHRMREAATLSEIEANRGFRRCRRDVDRRCTVRPGNVGGNVPEGLRRASFCGRAENVEESQPSEERLERRVNDREPCRSLPIERAEQDAATYDNRLAEHYSRRSRCAHPIPSDPTRQPR